MVDRRAVFAIVSVLLLGAMARAEYSPAAVLDAAGFGDTEFQLRASAPGWTVWSILFGGVVEGGTLEEDAGRRRVRLRCLTPPWHVPAETARPERIAERVDAFARRVGPEMGPDMVLEHLPLADGTGPECVRAIPVSRAGPVPRTGTWTLLLEPSGSPSRLGPFELHRMVEPEPSPPPDAALILGLSRAAQLLGRVPEDVELVGPARYFGPVPGEPRYPRGAWQVRCVPRGWAESPGPTADTATCYVTPEGEVRVEERWRWAAPKPVLAELLAEGGLPLAAAIASRQAAYPPSSDSAPSWASETVLLCASSRSRVGAPSWARRAGALRVDLASGEMAFVHPGWGKDIGWVVAGRSTVVTSEEAGGAPRYIDADTGVSLDPALRPSCPAPSISADGAVLAYSRWGTGGDRDVFLDGLAYDDFRFHAIAPIRGHRRVSVPGEADLTALTPDGTRVYYSNGVEREAPPPVEGQEPPPPQYDWSLLVSPVDLKRPSRAYEKVLDLPCRPGRLSIFPDGKGLLLWAEEGMWIADLEAKTLAPFTLPELRDPDRPEAGPLRLREPAVSPDGTRLAFSGSTAPPDEKVGPEWYLYVCNLDGSGLKRVTPLEDEPVGFYTFPKSGQSAFDLEKAAWIARAEVQQKAELERLRQARERVGEGPIDGIRVPQPPAE